MDTGTAIIIGIAGGTFVAACGSSIFGYLTFREARATTGLQRTTTTLEAETAASEKLTAIEMQEATRLARQSYEEAQEATGIARQTQREERLSRRMERLNLLAEALQSASDSSEITAARYKAALARFRVALTGLLGVELPNCAAIARADAMPHQSVLQNALDEIQARMWDAIRELEEVQRTDT